MKLCFYCAITWAFELYMLTLIFVGRFTFEEKEKDMVVVVKESVTARPQGGMPLKTSIIPGW